MATYRDLQMMFLNAPEILGECIKAVQVDGQKNNVVIALGELDGPEGKMQIQLQLIVDEKLFAKEGELLFTEATKVTRD